MIRKRFLKQITAITVSTAMLTTLVLPNINIEMFGSSVKADNLPVTTLGSGSIGVGSNEAEAAKLPRTNTQGTYRYTTDNYNSNHQALDTNDWASNWLWSLNGNMDLVGTGALSGTAYALPLCYLMMKDGLRVTKPSMTSNETNISAYNILDNDTLCDFKIAPDWTCTNSNIDEINDWSYQALTTNGNQKLKTTMTQGSPFTFFELTNSNVLYIEKLRVTFPSDIVFEDTYNGSKIIVFRTNDITSSVNGYPGLTYQYYAMFLPEGATIDHLGTTDTTQNDRIGRLKITLPSDKTYASFAWICESQNHIDSQAVSYAKEYRPYAFNFITDTRADYSYNEGTATVSTTYKYTFDKKSESKADGTIMGILPHQYKNMSGYSYMSNNAVTIRGVMKFIKGSSYTTNMTYKGILPYMPSLLESDTAGRQQLQEYVDEFINTNMNGAGSWTLARDEGNETYYHGKKLNRSAQVVAAAKSIGDEESAEKVLNGLEANLEDWFTYSGSTDKHYFTYLGEGVGVLLGFPTSFNAVDQFNDHHFHYGYFIQSAACVGLWDKQWLNDYKDVIKQLIYDIACPYRDDAECVADCGNAYPYLRSFSPYEGHSWASGYEDERTGNNQESTSEAINAWAGIILYGQLTGDTEIRDLGIYLYTTEIAAADNYWFDIDEDIYKIQDTKYQPPMASMVWGGKVDYATWFGAAYTQGIQICPMQSWSFYFLNGGETISGKDYIKKFYNYDTTSSLASGGSVNLWNDMWSQYYALADPETAMNSIWTKDKINDGESRAHTYHYIQSLIDYGTPNLDFTSNDPMTSVFEKNGKYTFAVYNSSDVTKTVTFKDKSGNATTVKAPANQMTLFSSDDAGKPSYTIEYYGKDLDGSGYSLIGTDIKYAAAGTNVTALAKEFTGYEYDSANANNRISGSVASDDSLVLKVYYQRGNYTISYDLTGGQKSNTALYPSSYIYGQTYNLDTPVRDGYVFYGWYADAAYSKKIETINPKLYGNLTLYAKWIPQGTILIDEDTYLTFDTSTNGTFTIVGDTGYDSVNVLYKISNTESEAAQLAANKAEEGFVAWGMDRTTSGWTRTENFSANSGKYITFYFIRYDSAGGYKTEYGYGKIGAGSVVVEPSSSQTATTKTEQTTTAPQQSVDPSEVTDWTPVLNNTDVSYYICDGKTDKVSVKPEQHGDGVYIAYSLAGAFKSVTLNGESKVPTAGADYVISPSDIADAGYYILTVEDYYGNESVTIYFKVADKAVETTTNSPATEAPTTETPTTEAPTTQKPTEDVTTDTAPIEVFGQNIYSPSEGIIWVVWGQNQEQMTLGQKYNVYLDGNIAVDTNGNRLEGVGCNGYNVAASAGIHTIRITAVLNGYETQGVTAEVTVEGSTIIETTEAQTEKTTEAPTEAPTTSGDEGIVVSEDLQVNGYQLNTVFGGIRTVYSVEPVVNDKTVEEVGLIYSLKGYADTDDMYYGSEHKYVKSYMAQIGKTDTNYSNSETADNYVMTMKFVGNTAFEFSTEWMVRVYAKLSDGSYVYSDVATYSIYNVADQLYKEGKMPTQEKHDYLYNNILTVVNKEYTQVDYKWTSSVVKP